MLSYGINQAELNEVMRVAQESSSPVQQDKVVRITADEGQRDLVNLTPKKWTGDLRRSWQSPIGNNAQYTVVNTSPIMGYLEVGTKDHGPVKAKKLYIPKHKNAMVYRKGLKWGKDFVLTDRVKGIKARRYVEGYAPKAAENLVQNVIKYIFSKIK
jgi:hypothetical protein